MVTSFTEADAELTRRIGLTDLHSDLPLGLLKRRFEGSAGSLRDEWLPRRVRSRARPLPAARCD